VIIRFENEAGGSGGWATIRNENCTSPTITLVSTNHQDSARENKQFNLHSGSIAVMRHPSLSPKPSHYGCLLALLAVCLGRFYFETQFHLPPPQHVDSAAFSRDLPLSDSSMVERKKAGRERTNSADGSATPQPQPPRVSVEQTAKESSAKTISNRLDAQKPTGSACLYILDETIKLQEWLAYHYVVFPLGSLILGLSAESRRIREVEAIVGLWEGRIDITIWESSRYMNFDNQTGWERAFDGWEKDPTTSLYKSLVHKRNQKAFTLQCLWTLRKARKTWTTVTDVDEFLAPNYVGPHENASVYDTLRKGWTREDIDAERRRVKPQREALLPMTKKVTILEVLQTYNNSMPCVLFPQLKFSSYESYQGTPSILSSSLINQSRLLLTTRFRFHGPKAGNFSKAMVYLTAEGKQYNSFLGKAYQSIHNPHKGYCGYVGKTGSGADYISSLLRVNHYGSGSIESLLERPSDYRITDNATFEDFFRARNIWPVGRNEDIVPWVDWFIEKVGVAEAKRLLFQPLKRTYEEFSNFSFPELTNELQKLAVNISVGE
jgi:hypothetical protein